ncbi:unnamed protein product [Rhodiola kirilowii]
MITKASLRSTFHRKGRQFHPINSYTIRQVLTSTAPVRYDREPMTRDETHWLW